MTNPNGEQYFYACDHYYGLYLPNTTNSYGKALLRSVERAFTLGFTGLYHDDAGVTASAYSFHMWDGATAILDPTTKVIRSTPGSLPLIRLASKLQILETVLAHDGVMLMNVSAAITFIHVCGRRLHDH
eukprot:COSAG05_NODE_3_length_51333_cov_129.132080_29_plen_129_part_00